MKQLENMKETLIGCVQGEMSHLDRADYQEMGAAIDMIKDLSEAIYYCTITKAMEEKEKETHHYTTPMYMTDYRYRDMDRDYGRMYYNGNGSSSSSNGNSSSNGGYGSSNGGRRGYDEYPVMRLDMRDHREGTSPMTRKTYMEGKEMHHDKVVQMKELENYIQELGKDIVEMLRDASPEEKQLMQKKLSTLATKLDV